MHEEVFEQALIVGAAGTVIASGNSQKIEFLVGLDQRIHHLIRGRWVDVRIQFRHDKQKVSLQAVRIVDRGKAGRFTGKCFSGI